MKGEDDGRMGPTRWIDARISAALRRAAAEGLISRPGRTDDRGRVGTEPPGPGGDRPVPADPAD